MPDSGAGAARRLAVAAVAIDLDGTLLDTIPDLSAAVNAALQDMGRPVLPLEQVARYVGKGVEVLMHRTLTGDPDGRADPDLFEPALASFLAHYRIENGRSARPYPGVVDGLEQMRAMGLRLAVVTNKPVAFTEPLLAATSLAGFFELVVGGDSLSRKKPDPMPMLHVCERFGLPPAKVLAIGDSLNDVIAARASGMPVFAVPYGYNEGADVRSLDVDAIVGSLSEACQLLTPC